MSEAIGATFPRRALLLAALAWVLPTAGHLALGRRGRALGFAVILAVAFVLGLQLNGNLYTVVPGQPLSILATLGAMGIGAPYFLARFVFDYQGLPAAAAYEYGTVFLLSAGLMNLLLVLDVWDIATGRKESTP